jgi:hypothetical protein
LGSNEPAKKWPFDTTLLGQTRIPRKRRRQTSEEIIRKYAGGEGFARVRARRETSADRARRGVRCRRARIDDRLGGAEDDTDLAPLVRGLVLLRPLTAEALESIVQAARKAGPQLRAALEICTASAGRCVSRPGRRRPRGKDGRGRAGPGNRRDPRLPRDSVRARCVADRLRRPATALVNRVVERPE